MDHHGHIPVNLVYSPLIFPHNGGPVLVFVFFAAVSSTAELFAWSFKSLDHKPVDFALAGLACGANEHVTHATA